MQVSSPSHADLMVKLGVNKAVGLILVFLWMAVLVVTIVLRRHTSYEAHEELHWWEGFYRTGSIIFGGGQVCSLAHITILRESLLTGKRIGPLHL